MFFSYPPVIQTPKLVMIKNANAPDKAPITLIEIDLEKNLVIYPINKTLPQVNNVVEWNPINISVTAKQIATIGTNLNPKKTGI